MDIKEWMKRQREKPKITWKTYLTLFLLLFLGRLLYHLARAWFSANHVLIP